MSTTERMEAISKELDRLYEDSTYSSETFFAAAKGAEFYGKLLVLLPTLCAGLSSLAVALGAPPQLGAVGAISGAVAATATFLGSERKGAVYRESARRYTLLRHAVRLERTVPSSDEDQAEKQLRLLRDEYASIVSRDEPAPNRYFAKASKRISQGVFDYKE